MAGKHNYVTASGQLVEGRWPWDFDPMYIYPEGENLPYWTTADTLGIAVVGPHGVVAYAPTTSDAVKFCREMNRLAASPGQDGPAGHS